MPAICTLYPDDGWGGRRGTEIRLHAASIRELPDLRLQLCPDKFSQMDGSGIGVRGSWLRCSCVMHNGEATHHHPSQEMPMTMGS